MLANEFLELYPRLYHMAESDAWPSIHRLGLLSACALVELFEVPAARRSQLISQRRQRSERLEHPLYGTAVLRDQGPMSEAKLLACLTDLDPAQWYELLNRRVFLWPSFQKLTALLWAAAYSDRAHIIVTIDTARLIERYRSQIELCAINSGATLYNPPQRGSKTFRSLTVFPFEDLVKGGRSKKAAVAEVTVLNGITPIAAVVDRVDRVHPGGRTESLRLE
jgi:hypothetical protein